jgi:hypothetical protein
MTDHGDIILQLQRERSELIERLSRALATIAFCKGLLEANKLIATHSLDGHVTKVEEDALTKCNERLAEGLFGDGNRSEPE